MSGLLVFFAHKLTPIGKIVNNESVRFISLSKDELFLHSFDAAKLLFITKKRYNL